VLHLALQQFCHTFCLKIGVESSLPEPYIFTAGFLALVRGPCEPFAKVEVGAAGRDFRGEVLQLPLLAKIGRSASLSDTWALLSIGPLMKNPHNINGFSPAEAWNFDIDAYISPFIPSPRVLRRLPTCISRFLGHRNEAREGELDIVVWTWAFVGAFSGVAVVEAVFLHWSYFSEKGCPMIVGSYVCTPDLLLPSRCEHELI